MNIRNLIATWMLLLLAAAFSLAQAARPVNRGGVNTSHAGVYPAPGMDVDHLKGEPFSADVNGSMEQALADGNHIHRTWHEKIYRDSQGRTRTERERMAEPTADNPPYSLTFINDPISRVTISLDAKRKVADVHHYPSSARDSAANRPETGNSSATGPRTVPNTTVDSLRSVPHSQPAVATHTDSQGRMIKTEPLGTKEMEGLLAVGTRTTITIPAGLEGNEEPITTVTEVWKSHELRTDLSITRDDPRTGRNTRALENIERAEPDATLFEVPPDYTVHEDKVQTESGAAYDAQGGVK